MTNRDRPVILIAEDEPSVAEGYELWLSNDYDIRVAADGQAALDIIDDTVDVVLLDRMMPKLSGGQVLQEIRERGIDCKVAMVTAVEPDFDIIEMGFDAYITKPPEREQLLDTIETLLDRATLSDDLQNYHSLMARKGTLEAQKTEQELENTEEYQQLLDRIEETKQAVDEDLGDMESDMEFVSAVREIEAESNGFDDIELDEDDPFETEGNQ
jgi:DNA-binding response OmpR family regulator